MSGRGHQSRRFHAERRQSCQDDVGHIRRQLAEEVCQDHGVLLCPICFDMRPVDENGEVNDGH